MGNRKYGYPDSVVGRLQNNVGASFMPWEEEHRRGDARVACIVGDISARRKGRWSGDDNQGMEGYFLLAATQY